MNNWLNLPLNINLITSFIMILLSIIGIIVFNYKKDKLFLIIPVLLQFVFLGVIFNIIVHFANLLTWLALGTGIIYVFFLFAKEERSYPYIIYAMHFLSLLQIAYVLYFIR